MNRDEAVKLALAHADLGRPVFPVAISWDEGKQKTNKRPLTIHGHKEASIDPADIAAMFLAARPSDGETIGVGRVPDLVLDCDIRPDVDGHDTLAALESQYGPLPEHPIDLTPSGGSHHEFRLPEGVHVSQGAAKELGPGIDVRTRDGWVVASGTKTSWGEWVREESTKGIAPPLAPGWLLDRLGAVNGASPQNVGKWRPVDRTALPEADLEALECLEALGGHSEYVGSDGGLRITRPGKDVGASASIGHIGPGVAKVFTSNWPPLQFDGVYNLDDLKVAAGRSDVDVSRHPDPGKQGPDPSGTRGFGNGDAGGRYFAKGVGLLVDTLAKAIIDMGPLAYGIDDRPWRYEHGVWVPDAKVIRSRASELLGERYRYSHGRNAEDVVRFRIPQIACDPIPEIINFRNGLYHWRENRFVEQSPDVLSTVQLGCDFDPDAECDRFMEWLDQVVPLDLVPMVWELIAYLMYSGNPLHKAVMLVGSGRNGKGTFLRLMTALLGARNVTAISLHDLIGTRFATASLFGKIANIAGDIDGRWLENTAVLKAVTGGDSISAEHKGRDRFDFSPWAVPVFSANKVPASADVTTGYLSRWLVVPFPNSFVGREDRTLDRRLSAELSGIATTALQFLPRLLDRGDFELPESGREALAGFTRRVDQVRAWVDDGCELTAESWTPRTDLYQAYEAWAYRTRHKAVSSTEFYDRLDSMPGIDAKRRGSSGTRGYRGIQLSVLSG